MNATGSGMDRCNGFKIRGLNGDTDRVAVQSTDQTTWFLTRSKWAGLAPKWHEIAIQKTELIVLRVYGGQAVLELEPLGGPYGVLVVERSQGATRCVRAGSRYRMELHRDESVVIKTEGWHAPRDPVNVGQFGM